VHTIEGLGVFAEQCEEVIEYRLDRLCGVAFTFTHDKTRGRAVTMGAPYVLLGNGAVDHRWVGRRYGLSSVFANAHHGGAAYTGHLQLDNSFAWLATLSALTMLGVSAIAEILAYYVPGVDNLLDALAAFVAGTVVSAAVITNLPPMVKWTAAVIAGGGIAGITQGVSAILRPKFTVLTGGLGNSLIATAELVSSLLVSLLTLADPSSRSRWLSSSYGRQYFWSGIGFEGRVLTRIHGARSSKRVSFLM
jgi:hypothetical protein